MTINHDIELDAKGLQCPLPLLRLKKTLVDMNSGEVVKVLATDPAAYLDFGVFSEKSGCPILHYEQTDDLHIFYIQKN